LSICEKAPDLAGCWYDCEAVPETTEAYEDLRGTIPGAPVGMLESGTPGEPEGYELVMSEWSQRQATSVDSFAGRCCNEAFNSCLERITSSAKVEAAPAFDQSLRESMSGLRWDDV